MDGYNLRSVVYAGAVAGLISGIICSFLGYIWVRMGIFEFTPGSLIEILVSMIVLTLIFGTTFGLIYEKFYSLLPSEGLKKGLIFGLMVWFIKDIAAGSYVIFVARNPGIGFDLIVGGLYMWAIYGVILGHIYKKE